MGCSTNKCAALLLIGFNAQNTNLSCSTNEIRAVAADSSAGPSSLHGIFVGYSRPVLKSTSFSFESNAIEVQNEGGAAIGVQWEGMAAHSCSVVSTQNSLVARSLTSNSLWLFRIELHQLFAPVIKTTMQVPL